MVQVVVEALPRELNRIADAAEILADFPILAQRHERIEILFDKRPHGQPLGLDHLRFTSLIVGNAGGG